MTKEAHIKFWADSSADDWDTAVFLAEGKRFSFCLFSLHLSTEKLLKAIWIKENISSTPPYTHDLIKLTDDLSLNLNPSQYDFLSIITSWNIRGRYPDYSRAMQSAATESYIDEQLKKVKELRECLQKNI